MIVLSFTRWLMSNRPRLVASLLLALFVSGSPAMAQVAGLLVEEPALARPDTPQTLHIVILDGDEALNNIRERTAREPIVRIEDENHKPVAGALVLFTLHGGSTGAGGAFGSATSLSVTTGADGRAIAHGLQPNQTAGSYTISVNATVGPVTAEATIHQSNTPGANQPAQSSQASVVKRIGPKRNWLIASSAIAAGVVVVIIGTRVAGISITPGAGSVHQ